MRRSRVLVLLTVLALAGCVPVPFDPQTGAGYDGHVAEFDALGPEAQLALIAESDLASARSLWTESGIDQALGGEAAADDAFAGLLDLVDAEMATINPDESTFVLASTRSVAEAHGAGMFAGMLVSGLLTEAGLAATKDGATGSATHDFGSGGRISIEAAPDGVTTTTLTLSTEYRGVKIDLRVITEVNPCPDADGWVEPKGLYEVVIEGPDGTGNVTQVEVAANILVNDDAEIGMSDYSFHSVYVSKPKPTSGDLFDTTGGALDFGIDEGGELEINQREGWSDDAFITEAVNTGIFLARWVASSLEKSVEAGWKDGRCIDLHATPSQGPRGLEPGAEVSVLAAPVAKADGAPPGGSVTAELIAGGASVGPAGKVPADATFVYVAPDEESASGTVRFESRSKRGVGFVEVTFETAGERHYAITGGSGVFAGSGEWCASSEAFSVSGGDVTTFFQLDGAEGGSVQYAGGNASGGWSGGGSFTVSFQDGEPTGIAVAYSGLRYNLDGSVVSDSPSTTFTLTPKDSCDAR